MTKLITFRKSQFPNENVNKVSYYNNIIKINYNNHTLTIITNKRQNKKTLKYLNRIVDRRIVLIKFDDDCESFVIVDENNKYYPFSSKNKIKYQVVSKGKTTNNYDNLFIILLFMVFGINLIIQIFI